MVTVRRFVGPSVFWVVGGGRRLLEHPLHVGGDRVLIGRRRHVVLAGATASSLVRVDGWGAARVACLPQTTACSCLLARHRRLAREVHERGRKLYLVVGRVLRGLAHRVHRGDLLNWCHVALHSGRGRIVVGRLVRVHALLLVAGVVGRS